MSVYEELKQRIDDDYQEYMIQVLSGELSDAWTDAAVIATAQELQRHNGFYFLKEDTAKALLSYDSNLVDYLAHALCIYQHIDEGTLFQGLMISANAIRQKLV